MISKLNGYITIFIGLILAWFFGSWKGKREGRKQEKTKQIIENDKLEKKMDKAPTINSDDELYDKLHKNEF